MKISIKLLIITVLSLIIDSYNIELPTVIFHGIGGSCKDHYYDRLINYIYERNGPKYIRCIENTGATNDFFAFSFLDQAIRACEIIKKDSNLFGKDFSILGFSHGAVIGRYIVQACNFGGNVKRLISVGGPQMGIAKIPPLFHSEKISRIIEKKLIYNLFFQRNFGPAGIFRNPREINIYYKSSIFLADLNNETSGGAFNNEYKERMKNLDIMVLIKFKNDTKVYPKESEHFGYIDSKDVILDITETNVYMEDKIGLKHLLENDRIIFEEIEGEHLEYNFDDVERLILPYLK